MLVWEGMNGDHKLCCVGMKELSMSRWIVASQDVGTQQHQTQVLTAVLQTQTDALAGALAQVLALQNGGPPQGVTHKVPTPGVAFNVAVSATLRGNVPIGGLMTPRGLQAPPKRGLAHPLRPLAQMQKGLPLAQGLQNQV